MCTDNLRPTYVPSLQDNIGAFKIKTKRLYNLIRIWGLLPVIPELMKMSTAWDSW